MQLVPGLQYLRGNDGFIYCYNKIKAKRKDMTAFIAEGDEVEPITELEERKAKRKIEVKQAKEAARARKGRAKKKATKVTKPKETPVTASAMSPDMP